MAKQDKPSKKKRPRPLAPVSSITPKPGSAVSQYISFVMLLGTILLFCFFFYNVIKGFLLPLFLAILLAVIFRPFHEWMLRKLSGRRSLAAALATGGIMLIVLVPLTGLMFLGLYEANQVIRSRSEYIDKIEYVRRSVGLQKPFAQQLNAIEGELRRIDDAMNVDFVEPDGDLGDFTQQWTEAIHLHVGELTKAGRDAALDLQSDLLAAKDEPDEVLTQQVSKLKSQLVERVGRSPNLGPGFEATNRNAEKRALRYLLNRSRDREELGFVELLDALTAKVDEFSAITSGGTASLPKRNQMLRDVQVEYDELLTALLGGPIWKWGIELANPSEEQIYERITQLTGNATRWLPSITNTATSLITNLLVGLCIMAVALFYFFLDGATMVNTFMHLSPLDDRHELELLQEFDKVSRAVVLATLLSAVAQGILGGIGYKLVGLHSIFLLTLLTAVLALIPFVGAAAIWVPACLYLAVIKEPIDPEGPRTWMYARAGFLAVYGVLVISMADNVIKPWVLKGQSKLHPLLALLSVLGGVQALGPIGILIGPMVVAFLQVLLTILQREIRSLDADLNTTD